LPRFDQLRDQRANRGGLPPRPAPHEPSGQLGWDGGDPGGPSLSQGHLVLWRASPTGASASSFLLCLLSVQAAGAWQVRRRVCSAHRPVPQMRVQVQYKPRQTAARVTPGSTSVLFSPGTLRKSGQSASSLNLFLERGHRKGQNNTSSCWILFRGNYVTNRCPGSPQSRVSAAASPENGSRLRELPA
jgi:hypothetical protein